MGINTSFPPDVQSFVMNSAPEGAGASPITLILNWKPLAQ